MPDSEGVLLHVYPLQWLHIGERFNHAFRHPHVFSIVQPHDTIRKSCPCVATAGQFETICTGMDNLFEPQS